MATSISLGGQWVGYFSYGPEYGEELYGEKVAFRLFLDDLGNGEFTGKCIDSESKDSNPETSIVKGFVVEDFINFIKKYPSHFFIDEQGNNIIDEEKPGHLLTYTGLYDKKEKSFKGEWEIWTNDKHFTDGSFDVLTGIWAMEKVE